MEYTEEEKKAIENLRKSISINDCFINHDLDAIFKETMKISIDIVLNLLEKQKIALDNTSREIIARTEKLAEMNKNSIPKEAIRELLIKEKEIKKAKIEQQKALPEIDDNGIRIKDIVEEEIGFCNRKINTYKKLLGE